MSKRSFALLCGMAFILSFSVAATAALIPSIAGFFGRKLIPAGRLVWMYMLPYGIFALIWAPLTRKVFVKNILLACLLMFSLSAFITGISPNLSFACWGRMGMGIFGSCLAPLALIIIGKELSPRDKAKHAGIFFSVSYLSSLCGLFLSGVFFWRVIYLIPSLLGIIVFILAFFFLERFDYRGKFKISYIETFKDKASLTLFFFIFFGSLFYHSIQQWFGAYLFKEFSLSQFLISMLFALSALIAMFSESIGGFLSARFGPSKVASWGLLSMCLFIVFLFFVNKPEYIFYFIFLWGMGWAFNHIGLSVFLTGLPDKFLRDASGLNSSLRFVSAGLGAFLGGKLISLMGFKNHFVFVGIALFVLALFLRKKLAIGNGAALSEM